MFCFSLSPLRRGKVCPERAEGVRGLVIYSINQEENERVKSSLFTGGDRRR